MSYAVKEIFYSLQGEGAHAGRPAVFCRFAGCNLWSGREEDRATAQCPFCDTDFVGTDGAGGGRFPSAHGLASAILARWPTGVPQQPFVVLTGGEPSLQADEALVQALHGQGAMVAIETNGTNVLPPGLDWVCVSPKAGTQLQVTAGDEIKLVFPQCGLEPEALEALRFDHWFLQPKDGPSLRTDTQAAVDYCLARPRWRLSTQLHKALGIC